MNDKKQYIIRVVLETRSLRKEVEDTESFVAATFIDKDRANKFISDLLNRKS